MKKKQKRHYRIRNWREYNQALVQRGSVTVWVDEAALQGWLLEEKSGRRGASRLYSEGAIACALTLGSLYHLPLRATEGFLGSLLKLLGVCLPIPDFSTLARRRKTLDVALSPNPSPGQSQKGVHLVVDSTGFKVYGEGEWKVRQHGWSKRRTWRKLHLGVDEATGEVLAASATGPERADKEMLEELLAQVDARQVPLSQVSGDGGYDAAACYGAIVQRGARAAIPPQRRARLHPGEERWEARNQILRRIRELQAAQRQDLEWGRKQWKQESGYHRRSLAETAMMRLKTLFGDRLSARDKAAQDRELLLRCAILNRITALGMPQSYAL